MYEERMTLQIQLQSTFEKIAFSFLFYQFLSVNIFEMDFVYLKNTLHEYTSYAEWYYSNSHKQTVIHMCCDLYINKIRDPFKVKLYTIRSETK